jgi:hypothetical protein
MAFINACAIDADHLNRKHVQPVKANLVEKKLSKL